MRLGTILWLIDVHLYRNNFYVARANYLFITRHERKGEQCWFARFGHGEKIRIASIYIDTTLVQYSSLKLIIAIIRFHLLVLADITLDNFLNQKGYDFYDFNLAELLKLRNMR